MARKRRQKVQKLLGCKRASPGSLSEAVTVFDPERLTEIITELGQELVPLGRDPRLRDVPGLLTVVDGTLRIARTIRSAWWKCRRRPMSSGARIGEDLPGLVATASCGSPRTFAMICSTVSGLASEEELLAQSAKRAPQPPDS
jgi:hypothetical protein